jgi:hypothetical protein
MTGIFLCYDFTMKKIFYISFLIFAILFNVLPHPKIITVCPERGEAEYRELCTGKDKWGLDKAQQPGCACGVMPGLAVGFPVAVVEGGDFMDNIPSRIALNTLVSFIPTLIILGLFIFIKKHRRK